MWQGYQGFSVLVLDTDSLQLCVSVSIGEISWRASLRLWWDCLGVSSSRLWSMWYWIGCLSISFRLDFLVLQFFLSISWLVLVIGHLGYTVFGGSPFCQTLCCFWGHSLVQFLLCSLRTDQLKAYGFNISLKSRVRNFLIPLYCGVTILVQVTWLSIKSTMPKLSTSKLMCTVLFPKLFKGNFLSDTFPVQNKLLMG